MTNKAKGIQALLNFFLLPESMVARKILYASFGKLFFSLEPKAFQRDLVFLIEKIENREKISVGADKPASIVSSLAFFARVSQRKVASNSVKRPAEYGQQD